MRNDAFHLTQTLEFDDDQVTIVKSKTDASVVIAVVSVVSFQLTGCESNKTTSQHVDDAQSCQYGKFKGCEERRWHTQQPCCEQVVVKAPSSLQAGDVT